MSEQEIKSFLYSKNYDIRIHNDARWIDQKCTPDVVCIIADCISNYISFKGESATFTSRDIWYSDYAINNVQAIFRKVNVDDDSAENEYDKFFQQPMKMLSYAGILNETKVGRENHYSVKEKSILDYIGIRERNALEFLVNYIEKVLSDSDLIQLFNSFFESPTKDSYEYVKNQFCNFTVANTKIGSKTSFNGLNNTAGIVECRRIFIKVINPLAFVRRKQGTEKGRLSKHAITYDMLMYNRDNFRDIYAEKPKSISRKDYMSEHHIEINEAYFNYMSSKAKRRLKLHNEIFRCGMSEMPGDSEKASHIHHIFPSNEFPEISFYLENLIALTPNQHLNHAHPNGKTTVIDSNYQHDCLIVKSDIIKDNIDNCVEKLYSFSDFLYILYIGLNENTFLEIENGDFAGIKAKIESAYI